MGELTDNIVEYCQRHEYLYHLGDCEEQDPLVVLVGENHDPNDLPAQEELINIVQPKIILHEVFQKFDKTYSTNSVGERVSYDARHVRRISAWRHMFEVPVRRLDVSKAERKRIDERVNFLLELAEQPSAYLCVEFTSRIRETHMVRLVDAYLKQEQVPVFGIVGAGHIDYRSALIQYFFSKQIPHVVVSQSKEVKDYLDHARPYFVRP